MQLQKNALSVLLITTSLLSLCLHLVEFFCNFISTVTTDGVIPSCVMVTTDGVIPSCVMVTTDGVIPSCNCHY